MDKTFQPATIETRWYQAWEQQGYFAPGGKGPAYSIMIPPPNVTGSLHMGHGFQEAIMDALIRYHRMKGCNTLWQVGTDHAGIATQMVVERELQAAGKTRHDIGRDDFIKQVWEWKEHSGGTITRQLRRLGSSLDWSRERFTMDEGLSDAVKRVFVQLYEDGIIYRGKRLVNWDPVLLTAVSDLEVVSEEEPGTMYYVRYPFVDDEAGGVVIGTTRPETILVDGAVAVHPDDARFKPLVGKRVWVPMTEPRRAIEIITDEYVESDFGTGCVKITAAHDFNDYEVHMRHLDKNIPLIVLFTPDAKMNDNAPKKYRGMDRYDARKQIVHDLREQKLLVKEAPHRYKLPRGDRSGAVVEPMLTDQWYVDLTRETLPDGRPGGKAKIIDPAIEVVANGRVKFVPGNWSKTYYQWLENVEDWCISRQIWWGHRIPAWYDDDGNVYVGLDEAAVREKYALPASCALRQDEDVLDTWFSSALWPFSTLGWPQQTERLQTFYPTSVLVTGFDIIFFWVARMIMMGVNFMGEVPFHQVYIHGLVRDAHGQKMSKSKGNVLDPIDLIDGIDLETLVEKRTAGMMQPQLAAKIEKMTREEFPEGIAAYGTDALRFTYYSLASTGRDIKFDIGRIEGFRNFCNKIWNAARYVLMNCGQEACGANDERFELSLADRWIISRLQFAESEVEQAIAAYRFDLASQAVYEFIWNEYCDWYLELSKPVLRDDAASAVLKTGTRRTLIRVLEAALRLAHPLMPFITEDIWQKIAPLAGREGATIMLQAFPTWDESKVDTAAEADIEWLQGIIVGVRNIRGEMNIPPGRELNVLLRNGDDEDKKRLENNAQYLRKLAGLSDIRFLANAEEPPVASTSLVGELEILVPMAGLIDKEAELSRLAKEIDKLEIDLKRVRGKLENSKFVDKAPADVVAKERTKLATQEHALQKLQQQQVELRRL